MHEPSALKVLPAPRASAALLGFAIAFALASNACSTPAPSADPAPLPDGARPAAGGPQPSAAEPAADDGRPKVAFLGDSISAGLHLPADQAFPAIVSKRLAARGLPFQLLNAGVSGDTTAGGLRRVDWILRQAPDIVVVELGANDAMRGQPIASIEQNLRGIIDKLRARGATPLLLGMRIPTSYGPEYAAQYEAIYPRLADALDVAFVPFFMEGVAGVPEQNLQDGIHPTAQGHERLASTCEDALAQLVAAKRF